MGQIITTPCVVKSRKNHTILDTHRDFRYLIEEYMGYEAANLFDEILKDVEAEVDEMYGNGERTPEGYDNYEAMAESYHRLLVDTMNDLHEVLSQQRLSRKRLEEIHKNIDMEV